MTGTNRHPIQDEESYSIFITASKTNEGKTGYKLSCQSTTGCFPFDHGYRSWDYLMEKLEADLSIPRSALQHWHEHLKQNPGSTVRLGKTANGIADVFKGTAVKKLFRTHLSRAGWPDPSVAEASSQERVRNPLTSQSKAFSRATR